MRAIILQISAQANKALILVIITFLLAGCTIPFLSPEKSPSEAAFQGDNTLKIASWNLQIFGQKKSRDLMLLKDYQKIINNYDIVFVQEIRDIEGTAFPRLCAVLPEYKCAVSTPAGRSSSKEQYGIIYKNVDLVGTKDFNIQGYQGEFERPPFLAKFKRGNYQFSVIVMHTKPEDTPNEMRALEIIADDDAGRTIVLGDLNADCSYYPNKNDFDSPWIWAIKTGEDTTVKDTFCTYDRIIYDDGTSGSVIGAGVYRDGITTDMSDHYPVWIAISTT